jgi:hypothetical protein
MLQAIAQLSRGAGERVISGKLAEGDRPRLPHPPPCATAPAGHISQAISPPIPRSLVEAFVLRLSDEVEEQCSRTQRSPCPRAVS